jgi:hypothetical protein
MATSNTRAILIHRTISTRRPPAASWTLPENLYRAYQLTGDERYKKFADLWRYAAYWGVLNGSSEPKPYRFHAYSHVNTLCSAARTYEVTGDPQYLKTIRNA